MCRSCRPTGALGSSRALSARQPSAAGRHQPSVRTDSHCAELVKTLEVDDGRVELHAITGPDYGRIYDHERVAAVQRISGNGTGDTRWKVPGVLDWSTGIYNPRVDVTRDTTTLYASDWTSSCFWLTTSIRSKRGGCRMARPTSTSAASIAGTLRSAPRHSGLRASISGPSAKIAISGVSKTSRRLQSVTRNLPHRASLMRWSQR